MPLVPFDWNVIIRGFWNKAIFTPNRVSKNLFGLDEGTALQVLVPIDGMNPLKMIHNNIVVSVNSDVLEIAMEKYEFPKIKECLDIGTKALSWLKETPVFAGGYNIRFKLTQQDAMSISDSIKTALDNSLSDAGYTIKERSSARVVVEGNGEIRLITKIGQQGDVNITINFNKNSFIIADIVNWFSVSADYLEKKTKELLENVYGIKESK